MDINVLTFQRKKMVEYNVNLEGKTVLVTGAAGFIGSNLVKRLFHDVKNIKVIGIDSITDYYDVNIKYERLKEIEALGRDWTFVHASIADKEAVEKIFTDNNISIVVNLAAQAGVRYSITNPDAYIQSNLIGFYNILEACRHHEVEHLVYASSSSVYGSNKKVPYSTDDKVDNPVSLYAATKKSNELMAHAYSKLYNIPSTGLRFFTVYGPAGRPDMAYFGFTNKLVKGDTIKIFNYGNCKRDFTFVDDIVEGVVRIMQHAPEKQNGEDGLPIPPYKVYNIGNNSPENLLDFVTILQEELVRAGVLPKDYDFEAHKELVPMQPGDVPVTYADTTPLEQDFGFKPNTSLREGLRRFAEWYGGFCQSAGRADRGRGGRFRPHRRADGRQRNHSAPQRLRHHVPRHGQRLYAHRPHGRVLRGHARPALCGGLRGGGDHGGCGRAGRGPPPCPRHRQRHVPHRPH